MWARTDAFASCTAILLLSGCAANWKEEQRLESVTISWERTEEIQKVCADLLKSGSTVWLGCSNFDWSSKTCRIYAPASASELVLGHELKHCFGWMHREEKEKK